MLGLVAAACGGGSRTAPPPRTQPPTAAVIADLERSNISLTTENRLIDLAVSASLGLSHDCFEGLEAMRPVPSLAGHGCR